MRFFRIHSSSTITFTARPENDVITGFDSSGYLTIYGGQGDDRLTGGAGITTIYGGPGNDRMFGGGYAKFFGGGGNDVAVGSSSGDEFLGGPGKDKFDGRGGSDLASFGDKTASITVTLHGST